MKDVLQEFRREFPIFSDIEITPMPVQFPQGFNEKLETWLTRKLTEEREKERERILGEITIRASNEHKLSEKFWRNGGNKPLQRTLNAQFRRLLAPINHLRD